MQRRSGLVSATDPAQALIEHEIANAATVVRGYLRRLLGGHTGSLSADQRNCLQAAEREAERIGRLLEDLLALGADEANAFRVVLQPEVLGQVIERAAISTRPFFEHRCVLLEIADGDAPPTLPLDGNRIEQVLINLLGNAAKFAPRGSLVRVEVARVDRSGDPFTRVRVVDAGPGVAKEDAARIFEPWVRGRAAHDAGVHGAGLGLAVSRRIVEAHGGDIEAVPGVGHGLFQLFLREKV
jgi:signal transduction histidine kinase